jgi:tetratricopeptide (TPR) repeat protein
MDIDELIEQVATALEEPDVARAAQILERASDAEFAEEDQALVVRLWEDLADAYAERGRFDDAIAAIRRCQELEYASDHDLRGSVAAHLLRADREDEADELWEVVATEQPEEVTLRFVAGVAYQELERHEDALGWFDEALELVLQHGDHEGWLVDLLQARDESLDASALQPDDLQKRGEVLLAQQTRHVGSLDPAGERRLQALGAAVDWVLREEWDQGLQLWPDLAQEWGPDDYQAYARHLQAHLLRAAKDSPRPVLAPVYVEAFLEWADARAVEASDPASRDTYAQEVARLGNAVPWPPGKREQCWCGTGEKYKKCCQTVTL